MLTKFAILFLAGAGVLGCAANAQAQVFIRVPFVRVEVGDGVYVRAPFVRVFVPSQRDYPVYIAPVPAESVPAVNVPTKPPAKEVVPAPLPKGQANDLTPPKPLPQAAQVMSLEAFAKTFKAQPGTFEVMLMNPVTKQATNVRFTLPEGTPRKVHVRQFEVEFDYGPMHFVRIRFDQDGAMVTSR